jgi:hypothetical protein
MEAGFALVFLLLLAKKCFDMFDDVCALMHQVVCVLAVKA